MTQEQQFLEAIGETLNMALRAITTNLPKDEMQLTAAMVQLRIGQIKREIGKTACVSR